jgi:hypothetical protein
MNKVKEIAEKFGMEFDEQGYSKGAVSLKQLQRIFDSVVDENNFNWQKSAIDNMNAPFVKMQEKLKDVLKDRKV